MDGRKTIALLACLLAGLVGCDQKRLLPLWPGNRAPAPDVKSAPAVVMDGPASEEPITLKPATLVAMGTFREQQALEPNVTPQQQEYLRDKARKAYERALGLDAKCVTAHLALARLHETMGNRERALESYQQVLKLEPSNPGLYHEIGMVLGRRKDWEASLQMLQKAIELDPDNRAMVRSYGLALARSGRTAESLDQLRKVLSEAEARLMVARMLHHLNQPEACRLHLQLALQIDPNLEAAQSFQAELQEQAAPIQPVRAELPADAVEPSIRPAPPRAMLAPRELAEEVDADAEPTFSYPDDEEDLDEE